MKRIYLTIIKTKGTYNTTRFHHAYTLLLSCSQNVLTYLYFQSSLIVPESHS
jgi:hypothetical protein